MGVTTGLRITAVLRNEIDAHRDEHRKNPDKRDHLVHEVVPPHFDSKLAARLVLARHWNDASVEQRRRFVDAFYHLLLHNFGADLVAFSLDRLQVLPYRGDAVCYGADAGATTQR